MLSALFYDFMIAANRATEDPTASNPGGSIDQATRDAVMIAFSVLIVVAAIAMIVIVMMQKGTNDNVGVIAGASDTYYGKHKEKGKEGVKKKITLALFVFILVCSLIVFIVKGIQ